MTLVSHSFEIPEARSAPMLPAPHAVEAGYSTTATTLDETIATDGLGSAMQSNREPRGYSQIVEVAGGRKLHLMSYFDGDPRHEDLTRKIAAGRQRRYKEEGLLKSAAKNQDDIRGANVEVIALVDPETTEPVASLRKIHADSVEGTPSYSKFAAADAFDANRLHEFRERAASRPVVEIGALWKESEYGNDAALVLYRQAIHDSIERDEIMFMGIVPRAFNGLLRTFGPKALQRIGNQIPVTDEDAEDKVRILPAALDPRTLFDDLMDQAETARNAGNDASRFTYEIALWHFFDGLGERAQYLNPSTVSRLGRMCNGNY